MLMFLETLTFLLGADMYPDVFDDGRKSTPLAIPIFFRNMFGWVSLVHLSSLAVMKIPLLHI